MVGCCGPHRWTSSECWSKIDCIWLPKLWPLSLKVRRWWLLSDVGALLLVVSLIEIIVLIWTVKYLSLTSKHVLIKWNLTIRSIELWSEGFSTCSRTEQIIECLVNLFSSRCCSVLQSTRINRSEHSQRTTQFRIRLLDLTSRSRQPHSIWSGWQSMLSCESQRRIGTWESAQGELVVVLRFIELTVAIPESPLESETCRSPIYDRR